MMDCSSGALRLTSTSGETRKGINTSGRVGTREQYTDKRGLAEQNEWVAIP